MKIVRSENTAQYKPRALWIKIIWWLAVAGFIISAAMLAGYFIKTNMEKKKLEELKAIITQAPKSSSQSMQQPESSPPTDEEILAGYNKLAQQNGDMVGWLSAQGTQLDYPVMQTKKSPEFYLRRDFDKKYAISGIPFADAKCDVNLSGSNVIIYGHNMKDGSMFGAVDKYQQADFWQQHKQLRFDTLTQRQLYNVFAVVVVDTDVQLPDALAAYQLKEGGTQEEFDKYISFLKEKALYETDITPIYGDSLLTLSTCNNIEDTMRIVLVAVKEK